MAIAKEQNPDIIAIDSLTRPLLRLQIEHK